MTGSSAGSTKPNASRHVRPGQRDVVLADLAALVGHEQPDHPPVPLVAAPLDVSLPDQRVHHRGQRAGRRPAPRRDVAGLEPVPGHQHPQHAEPGRADPQPGLGQGARVERAHDPGCGQQQHVQRRVRRRIRVSVRRLAPDPARSIPFAPARTSASVTPSPGLIARRTAAMAHWPWREQSSGISRPGVTGHPQQPRSRPVHHLSPLYGLRDVPTATCHLGIERVKVISAPDTDEHGGQTAYRGVDRCVA